MAAVGGALGLGPGGVVAGGIPQGQYPVPMAGNDVNAQINAVNAQINAVRANQALFPAVVRNLNAHQMATARTLQLVRENSRKFQHDAWLAAGAGVKVLAKAGLVGAAKAAEKSGEKVIEQVAMELAKEVTTELGEEVAKELTKELIMEAARGTIKEVAAESAKAVGENYLKKVPLVSVVFGVALGTVRFMRGQPKRALGEFASGVAGCFLGWGTAISLAIDASLLAVDISELNSSATTTITPPAFTPVIANVEEAYGCLAIDPRDGARTPRARVDQAYRELQRKYHPDTDTVRHLGPTMVEEYTQLSACLTAARDFIYRSRGWR